MEQSASAAEAAKPGSSPGLQQQAQKLVAVAACVRAAYLLMVAVFALLFADYDTSTSILSESCADNWPDQAASAQRYLPAVVWDSIFLNRIAACGYEYEQFFAFYPGVPGLIRLLRSAGVAPGPWGFAIIGLVVNNASFLLSVWLLTKLSQQVVQNVRVVSTAVLIFIFTPASIHHSMVYTEALFTLTSWLGLYCLYCLGSSLGASLAFAASSAVRSNGLLNAGFILHEHGRLALSDINDGRWVSAVKHGVTALLCTAVCAFPYLAYMLYSYREYCTGVYGEGGPHQQRPWCTQTIPSAYGYVQRVYWHVGFLKYYTANQTPNFFLAGPTLAISLWGALAYAAANPHTFITGGLLPLQLLQTWFGSKQQPHTDSSSSSSSSAARSSDSKGGSQCSLGPCCKLVGCIVGSSEYCSSSSRCNACAADELVDASGVTEAAAAVKGPAIPGVAFQSLRQRQQEVSVQKQDHHQQQQQTAGPGNELGGAAVNAVEQQQQQQQQQCAAGGQGNSSSNSSRSRAKGVNGRGQHRASTLATDGDVAAAAAGDGGTHSNQSSCSCSSHQAYYRPEVTVFVVHWLVLTLVCLAVVHIQVSTRLLSSCAPLYWFAALLMLHKGRVLRWLLWWYCCAYMGVGAVFFVNFYPWV